MNETKGRMKDRKRLVIKIGTSTITHHHTGRLNIRRIEKIVKILADLQNAGHEVILVSSGSIGLGMSKLGMLKRPKDTVDRQACAAVGQCELMYLYDDLFSNYGITVAQILLTKFVLDDGRERNVKNAINRLLEKGVIPIVNENDTVAIDELELEMGENDSLAAQMASIAEADLLIILSDIDGLYDSNPRENTDAKLIPYVKDLSDDIFAMAGGAGTKLGSGGMKTKLTAVELAYESDIDVVIMSGYHPEKLYDLFEDKQVGTLFSKSGRF